MTSTYVAASCSNAAITTPPSCPSHARVSSSPTRPRSARRWAARCFTPNATSVATQAPTNDYALFCLGRSMQQLGRHREACHSLALACSLRPERRDYRVYRDRARRAAFHS
jgi:hypothetical protein